VIVIIVVAFVRRADLAAGGIAKDRIEVNQRNLARCCALRKSAPVEFLQLAVHVQRNGHSLQRVGDVSCARAASKQLIVNLIRFVELLRHLGHDKNFGLNLPIRFDRSCNASEKRDAGRFDASARRAFFDGQLPGMSTVVIAVRVHRPTRCEDDLFNVIVAHVF